MQTILLWFYLINGLYMLRTFTCSSSGFLIYRLFHCRMWCYAIGVEAVVLRSWCVVLCTLCQLVSNCLHQVGTSSLLIYMMHGHTYIKFTINCCSWLSVRPTYIIISVLEIKGDTGNITESNWVWRVFVVLRNVRKNLKINITLLQPKFEVTLIRWKTVQIH